MTALGPSGAVPLAVGSEVIFGNQTFRWDGRQLIASATAHEFTLYADGLTQVVAGGKRLIENVSFKLEPRTGWISRNHSG